VGDAIERFGAKPYAAWIKVTVLAARLAARAVVKSATDGIMLGYRGGGIIIDEAPSTA
jgi:hypothetical protein